MRTDKNYYLFVLAAIVLAMIYVGVEWLFQQWWFIVLFVIVVLVLIGGLVLWIRSKFFMKVASGVLGSRPARPVTG